MGMEQEEGDKKEWKAVGGEIVDTLTNASALRIKFHVKNLNKSVMERVLRQGGWRHSRGKQPRIYEGVGAGYHP